MNQPPRFDILNVPEAERDEAWLFQEQLRWLQDWEDNFCQALRLFDFSSSSTDFRPWRRIACRDAAMTIFHFNETLQFVSDNVPAFLDDKVDHCLLAESTDKFEKAFPASKEIRHAVAHMVERTGSEWKKHSTSERIERPGLSIASSGNIICEMLSGRTYSNTWKGRFYSYEISLQTLQVLHATREQVWTAFSR